MQKDQAQRLAETLTGLRKRQRLSQRGLGEVSGLSRAIISIIERAEDPSTGQPPNPHPDTLQRLAHGLATDGDGAVSEALVDTFYGTLMDAAGYLPPDPPGDPNWDFLGELHALLPSSPRYVDELYRQYEHDSIAAQQAIVSYVRDALAAGRLTIPTERRDARIAEHRADYAATP